MKRKLLAILMTLSMVVCMMPAAAFAEGEVTEEQTTLTTEEQESAVTEESNEVKEENQTAELNEVQDVGTVNVNVKWDDIFKTMQVGKEVPAPFEYSVYNSDYNYSGMLTLDNQKVYVNYECFVLKDAKGDIIGPTEGDRFEANAEYFLAVTISVREQSGYKINANNEEDFKKNIVINGAEVEVTEYTDTSHNYAVAFNIKLGTTDDIQKKANSTSAKTKFIAQGKAYKTSIKYSWNKVSGATKYKVYQAKCGKKKYKCVKTTSGTSYTKKNLRRKANYKAYVVAYNKNGKKLAKTPLIHNMTTKGGRSNATAVSAKKTASVKVGSKVNVKAKIAKKDSKKTLLWKHHVSAAIRYYSADKSVATVDAKGNVKGVKAGTANIYAVAPSGVYAVTKVTVKAAESSEITITLANSDGKTTTLKTAKKTWAELTGTEFTIDSVDYQITNTGDADGCVIAYKGGSSDEGECFIYYYIGGQKGDRIDKPDQIVNGAAYLVKRVEK